ncbi:MAG: triose-phosphate isomerase [Syntrophales bacterium]|nr:triose-phosphate isomerase [Syntrophales bacterium]
MIRPFIAGNWKMNKTIGEAVDFASRLRKTLAEPLDRDVVIAPSFTALYAVAEALKDSGIHLCAQNLHEDAGGKGAYTGEVSAPMLADAGCEYVIIGHSERRTLFGERDKVINKKVRTALKFGLRPILCLGETLKEREQGKTFAVVERQIKEGLNNFIADDIKNVIVAYEPVWAIGTGKTATPEQAGEVHAFIRHMVETNYEKAIACHFTIIYGGSVSPDNIRDLMAQRDINGALVGGASLDVESFTRIVRF